MELINFGLLTRRAEDAPGTPTQSHVSPSIRVYEDTPSTLTPKRCVFLAAGRGEDTHRLREMLHIRMQTQCIDPNTYINCPDTYMKCRGRSSQSYQTHAARGEDTRRVWEMLLLGVEIYSLPREIPRPLGICNILWTLKDAPKLGVGPLQVACGDP